jgi:hypothetical protein
MKKQTTKTDYYDKTLNTVMFVGSAFFFFFNQKKKKTIKTK